MKTRGATQAESLDVDAVLDFSVLRDGAHLEVEARLLGVADGVVLHHLRARVPEGQLMQLALRIVSGVGGALRARSTDGMTPATLLDDAETLALYSQARRLFHQGWAEPNDAAWRTALATPWRRGCVTCARPACPC